MSRKIDGGFPVKRVSFLEKYKGKIAQCNEGDEGQRKGKRDEI